MDEAAIRQFIELERTHFWFVGRRRIFGHLLARELDGRHDVRVLDVGCGAGGMLELLSAFGSVKGIDSSAELVEYCHSRGYADVHLGTATELPVADQTVDVLTLFDTIEHVEDDAAALRETRRVLAPGGLVFISTPAYQFLYANNDRIAHHQRRYTARQLKRKLLAAGLQPTRVTYFNTLLFPVILPIVLAGKVRERFTDPGDQTNLSTTVPPAVNRLLAGTMGGERHLLARRNLPFGHSIIAVARRAIAGSNGTSDTSGDR